MGEHHRTYANCKLFAPDPLIPRPLKRFLRSRLHLLHIFSRPTSGWSAPSHSQKAVTKKISHRSQKFRSWKVRYPTESCRIIIFWVDLFGDVWRILKCETPWVASESTALLLRSSLFTRREFLTSDDPFRISLARILQLRCQFPNQILKLHRNLKIDPQRSTTPVLSIPFQQTICDQKQHQQLSNKHVWPPKKIQKRFPFPAVSFCSTTFPSAPGTTFSSFRNSSGCSEKAARAEPGC